MYLEDPSREDKKISKEFFTQGTGSNQVLHESPTEKIPVYDDQAAVEADLANLAVGQFIVTKEVSVRENTIFNTIYPIGVTYVQYPGQKSPNELWPNISTWEEIDYSGAFFRASGGNADSFIAEGGTLTPQAEGTAVNGLSIGGGNHSHIYDGIYLQNGSSFTTISVGSAYLGKIDTRTVGNGAHSHTITGDTETRPSNFTIKIWKRTA